MVTLSLVFIIAARAPLDNDLWWHLKVGEEIVKSGAVSSVDTYSFTRIGGDWINHSWLWRVLIYEFFQLGSYFGLGVFVTLFAVLSMGFVYLQIPSSFIVRSFVTLCSALVASVAWSPRPQMISLFFLALLIWLLYNKQLFKKGNGWILLPLFILWSNFHGGYLTGFIVISAFLLGDLLNRLINPELTGQLTKKELIGVIFWSSISFLGVAINPNGIKMWMIPFQTVDISNQLIDEWASPNFHDGVQQLFLWLFLLIILLVGSSKKRQDARYLITFIIFGFMAFWAKRNIATFAIASSPIFAENLTTVSCEAYKFYSTKYGHLFNYKSSKIGSGLSKTLVKGVNLFIVFILAFVGITKLYVVTSPIFIDIWMRGYFPVNAIKWLNQNPQRGQIFNDYNWGGYLIWFLPEYPVYIDGRADLYGKMILDEYASVVQANGDWEGVLEKWGINTLIIDPKWPLSKILEAHQFQVLYHDDIAIIYSRSKSP